MREHQRGLWCSHDTDWLRDDRPASLASSTAAWRPLVLCAGEREADAFWYGRCWPLVRTHRCLWFRSSNNAMRRHARWKNSVPRMPKFWDRHGKYLSTKYDVHLLWHYIRKHFLHYPVILDSLHERCLDLFIKISSRSYRNKWRRFLQIWKFSVLMRR